jgi:hypothetical protein
MYLACWIKQINFIIEAGHIDCVLNRVGYEQRPPFTAGAKELHFKHI